MWGGAKSLRIVNVNGAPTTNNDLYLTYNCFLRYDRDSKWVDISKIKYMQNWKKKENFEIDIFANLLERKGGYYTSSFAFLHALLYTSLLAKRSVRYNIENFFLTLDSNCLLYLSSLFEIGALMQANGRVFCKHVHIIINLTWVYG